MKRGFGLWTPLVAFLGLACFTYVLVRELGAYRGAVTEWAERDLRARTELAARTLRVPIETGDFRTLHAFGNQCTEQGVRVTVLSIRGGIVFDSRAGSVGIRTERPEVNAALRNGVGVALRTSETLGEEFLYCAQRAGDHFVVRLALPSERVFAPMRRGRSVLLWAGLTGGAGVLLIAWVSVRQRLRMETLERERDAQALVVAEMRRVEAFRRDFVANVSHEIKTPLTGILGAVDLLDEESGLSEAESKQLLALLRTEATRLNALAQELLSLARLERIEDVHECKRTPVEIAELIQSVVRRLQPKADAAGISFHIEKDPPMQIVCDPSLVEQAISNLLENAIRHSGGTEISISWKCQDTHISIAVEDDGCGIQAPDQERIFDRFYRVDQARSDGGSGLGLAIVRQIAHLHGGEVSCQNRHPKGARFLLRIKNT